MNYLILYGIGHKYASYEPAVDMTAMWLGFSVVFEVGSCVSIKRKRKNKSVFDFLTFGYSSITTEETHYGYLTARQIKTIARNIRKLA